MVTDVIKQKLGGKGGRIIFICGIIGILLIFFSTFTDGTKEKTTTKEDATAVYCSELEDKVCTLVKEISGSRRVSVVITLDSGKQYVYADEGRTTTTDATSDREQSYAIIRSSNGGESGLLITEYLPTVRGVAIVCDSLTQQAAEEVKSAVKAALDISEKKIHVSVTY